MKIVSRPFPRFSRWLGCLTALTAAFAADQAKALTVTAVTSDNGYPAHQVTWTDSAGLPRTAVMVDQNSNSPGPYTGYLRRYIYQINGKTRVCTGTTNYATGGNLEFSGEGFVQNHTAAGGDYSSGNGPGFPGTTTITLQGTSHAIITYTIPNYKVSGSVVPTTVQWFFADGRSHPVFSVSQDARNTAGNLGGDSRTPYSDMAYDGDGVDALVGGFSYGDTYKFVTLATNPVEVTKASPWSATIANTIPYTMQWAEPATVDAEMGHVATLPISVSDQGGDTQTSQFDNPPDLFDPRDKSRPNGPLPPANTYAYQIINDTLPASGPTDSKRLAWGSNFGRVGGFDNYGDTSLNVTQYSQHSTDPLNMPLEGDRADGLLLAYSTFIVLGSHQGGFSSGTVGLTVKQMEYAAASALTAATGTVVTSGPAGVGNASNSAITYTPAGYNPTFAGWEVVAAKNAVDATLTPASGVSLDHPLFIVDGYSAATLPDSISINGASKSGTDYFVTLDASAKRLYITANEAASGAVHLVVTAPLPVPVITSATTATATQGSAFSYQITATNSPTSYGVQGLPAGLSADSKTGLISGSPKGAGTVTLTLNAYNSGGKGSAPLTLKIAAAPPVITSATTATATVGVAFSYQITASNQPTKFGVQGLPPGITVNTSTGVVSGKFNTTGTVTLTLNAYNAVGKGSATLKITVVPLSAPEITSPEYATGTNGEPFTYQITATNAPTRFGVQGLPPGMTADGQTGIISGTPNAPGYVPAVTVTAFNRVGQGSESVYFVFYLPAPVITSPTTATGTQGQPFSYQVTATNSPDKYGASGLPANLSIDPATGLISGTPQGAGKVTVTLTAYKETSAGSATLTLTIAPK